MRHADGFELFHNERLKAAVGDICLEVGRQISVDGVTGEHAGHDRTHGSADGVNAEGVQRVIITEPAFDLVAHEPADGAGGDADPDGTLRRDVTASGSDHDQTRDRAGAETKHARLAFDNPFPHRPDEGGNRRGNGRGGEGVGRNHVSRDSAAGVETIPADPQHAGADVSQHQTVRREVFFAEAYAFAEDQAED